MTYNEKSSSNYRIIIIVILCVFQDHDVKKYFMNCTYDFDICFNIFRHIPKSSYVEEEEL